MKQTQVWVQLQQQCCCHLRKLAPAPCCDCTPAAALRSQLNDGSYIDASDFSSCSGYIQLLACLICAVSLQPTCQSTGASQVQISNRPCKVRQDAAISVREGSWYRRQVSKGAIMRLSHRHLTSRRTSNIPQTPKRQETTMEQTNNDEMSHLTVRDCWSQEPPRMPMTSLVLRWAWKSIISCAAGATSTRKGWQEGPPPQTGPLYGVLGTI